METSGTSGTPMGMADSSKTNFYYMKTCLRRRVPSASVRNFFTKNPPLCCENPSFQHPKQVDTAQLQWWTVRWTQRETLQAGSGCCLLELSARVGKFPPGFGHPLVMYLNVTAHRHSAIGCRCHRTQIFPNVLIMIAAARAARKTGFGKGGLITCNCLHAK